MVDKPPTGVSGHGHPSYEEEFRVIGHILEADARQIMERWFERATQEQMHATAHRRKEAMNELFKMLRSLGQQLHKQSSQALVVAGKLAHEHGKQRFDLGWDIAALVRDYEILHGVVLEHLGKSMGERLTYRQAMILATVMNGAIGHAVNSYNTLTQQRLTDQVQQQRGELRQLTLDLIEAEHHERQRIAGRLHDDLQQVLVAMRMRLHTAFLGKTADPTVVEETIGLADQAIMTTRSLAADLYPLILENRNLPEAFEWLAEMFNRWYSLKVTVVRSGPHDCNPGSMPMRRLVYDAVRELLFNVVKHARTDQAWLRIYGDETSAWRIEVEDRGVGSAELASTAMSTGRTMGLGSVRNRIVQIGGTMEVHSTPGEGTRLVLNVPLTPE